MAPSRCLHLLLSLDIVLSFQEVEASYLSLLQTKSEVHGTRAAVSTHGSITAQQVSQWMSMGELARVVRAGKLNISGKGMLKLTSSAGLGPKSSLGHRGFVNFVTDTGVVGQRNAPQMTLEQDLVLGEAPRPKPSAGREPLEPLEPPEPLEPEPQRDRSAPLPGPSLESVRAPSLVLAPSSNAPSVVLPILEEHLAAVVADAGDLRDVFGAMDAVTTLPPLGFVQTPHTGGIVSDVLHRLARRRKLSFYDNRDQGSTGMLRLDMMCTDAVFDHAWMSAHLKPQPLLFTVLRSPLEQMRSEFEQCGYRCGKDWPGRLDWLKRATSSEASRFVNPQAHQLGWDAPMDKLDELNPQWFGQLGQMLGIVLLAEHLNEGLVLLGRKLGLNPRDLEYVGTSEDRHVPPSKQAAELRRFLAIDEELYAHFNKTFWFAWEVAGGYDSMGADVEELQLRSQALERACKADDSNVCTSEFRIGHANPDVP